MIFPDKLILIILNYKYKQTSNIYIKTLLFIYCRIIIYDNFNWKYKTSKYRNLYRIKNTHNYIRILSNLFVCFVVIKNYEIEK